MTIDELAEVYKNENSTVLEKTVANAIKQGMFNVALIVWSTYCLGLPYTRLNNV